MAEWTQTETRGDDPGRLLPEARQLLHDLDLRVLEAGPVIANLAGITRSLEVVCAKLEQLVSNPLFVSLMSEQQRHAIYGGPS